MRCAYYTLLTVNPLIEFAPDDEHPLVLDWKNGITLERAIEFVAPVLHKH